MLILSCSSVSSRFPNGKYGIWNVEQERSFPAYGQGPTKPMGRHTSGSILQHDKSIPAWLARYVWHNEHTQHYIYQWTSQDQVM